MKSLATTAIAELEAAFRDGYEEGLTALDERFRPLLLRFIKRVCGGALGVEDLVDCYQETLLHLTRLTRREDFDPRDPLRLVFSVARRKTIDALRRRDRHRCFRLVEDPPKPEGAAPLKDEDYAELVAAVCEAVDGLPRRQRLVARSFVRRFEDLGERRKYQLIADDIRERSGEELSAAATKSAWLKARDRIRAALARRGFAEDQGGAR